jgi:hypothetical protein
MRPLTILRSQSKYPAPDQNTGAGSIHLRSDICELFLTFRVTGHQARKTLYAT